MKMSKLFAYADKKQKELYKIYLGDIRNQFAKTLDNVSVKDEKGNVVPFKEAYAKKK